MSRRRAFLSLLLGIILLPVALGWLAYSSFGFSGAAYLAVAFVTALLRDIGYFIRSARVWPVIRETLDWSKVENRE